MRYTVPTLTLPEESIAALLGGRVRMGTVVRMSYPQPGSGGQERSTLDLPCRGGQEGQYSQEYYYY